MLNIFSPQIISKAHGLIYRGRFLFNYIIIGFSAVMIELFLQARLIESGINIYISSIVSILIGISFGFLGNIFFNFKIPHKKRNQAFKYFVIYSILNFYSMGYNTKYRFFVLDISKSKGVNIGINVYVRLSIT